MAWIYILTFPNGKQYVGQTINLKQRFYSYRSNKKTNEHNAIRKYGWNNIDRIEMKCSEKYLDWQEIEAIKNYNTLYPNGYNLETGGHINKHLSNETKRKLSESKKGKCFHSDEWKKQRSEFMKGKQYGLGWNPSEEYRKKKAEKMRGNHYRLGIKQSIEQIIKKSKSIFQIDLKSGIIIKEWESTRKAERELNIIHGNIIKVLKGKANSASGFFWRYTNA